MQEDQPFAGRQEPGSYERDQQYGKSLRACCQPSERAPLPTFAKKALAARSNGPAPFHFCSSCTAEDSC